MEAWRQRRTGEKEKTCLTKKLKNRLDSDRPSRGRPLRSKTPGGLVAAAMRASFVGKLYRSRMRRRATVMVRGVVSRWRAVSSLRRPGVGHLFRMELSAGLSKSPLKQDPPRAHSSQTRA